MSRTRAHRGPHPRDLELFTEPALADLRRAHTDFCWLLDKQYPEKAALKLVGDRFNLRERQRRALQLTAASDRTARRRAQHRCDPANLGASELVIDGYNVLLTVEAALSGGVLLLGRDETLRDLSAMSRHYRRVATTKAAVSAIRDWLTARHCVEVIWFLDRPVSNSARLRRLILDTVVESSGRWAVELTDRTDQRLIATPGVVATADGAILDRCSRWLNLARMVVQSSVPDPWIIDLRRTDSKVIAEASRDRSL